MDWRALENWLMVHGGASGWASSTVQARVSNLQMIHREGFPLDQGVAGSGESFLAEFLHAGGTPQGYNNYVIALNGLLQYRGEPYRFKRRRVSEPLRVWLSATDRDRLLQYHHPDPPTNRLHRAVLIFAMQTALRPSEAWAVSTRHLDAEGSWIEVQKTSKFGKKRRLPVERWMWSPVRPFGAYLMKRPDPRDEPTALWVTRDATGGGHLGPDWRRMSPAYLNALLWRIGKACGVRFNWQICRRTRARELLVERGWPLPHVSRFLGHNSITTTMKYLGIDDPDLWAWMERAPSKDPFSTVPQEAKRDVKTRAYLETPGGNDYGRGEVTPRDQE